MEYTGFLFAEISSSLLPTYTELAVSCGKFVWFFYKGSGVSPFFSSRIFPTLLTSRPLPTDFPVGGVCALVLSVGSSESIKLLSVAVWSLFLSSPPWTSVRQWPKQMYWLGSLSLALWWPVWRRRLCRPSGSDVSITLSSISFFICWFYCLIQLVWSLGREEGCYSPICPSPEIQIVFS